MRRNKLCAAWSLAAVAATGCVTAEPPPIVIDGDPGEWPETTQAWADAHSVYVRFAPDARVTLQGGARCTRVLLDLDADAGTGLPLADLGVDLELQVSPLPDEPGDELGVGTRVLAHAGGRTRSLSHADAGFEFAPTYSADSYEIRIARHPGPGSCVFDGLLAAGHARGVVIQTDAAGAELWRGLPFELDLPAPATGRAGTADALPPPTNGSIRVVSHNVLRGSPAREPDAFARVYSALDPDVILLQEWDGWSGERLVAWFKEHAPGGREWHAVAHRASRAGVAVVSRHPVIEAIDEFVFADGGEWPVRFVGAILDAPGGPLLAGSIHLKCCGSDASPEDVRRVHETRAINDLVRRVLDEHGVTRCVLGGDLNLVGSRPPLDALRAALDADGSDMAPAYTLVWGDATTHTWTDADSSFSPGRLDWLVYSDSTLTPALACVLETDVLSPEALASMGLEPADSRASDHLPLVLDLAPAE